MPKLGRFGATVTVADARSHSKSPLPGARPSGGRGRIGEAFCLFEGI
jgi:hypothetical protein